MQAGQENRVILVTLDQLDTGFENFIIICDIWNIINLINIFYISTKRALKDHQEPEQWL